MPTVTVDTSANISRKEAVEFINRATSVLAAAVGAPEGHVHIDLRMGNLMTWGGKIGGEDGAPHTAQIRVMTCGPPLSEATKNEIVQGVGELLNEHTPKPSTQFCFQSCGPEDLAIDGLLLPDLIKRDAPQ